jgi:hypothetical protein
MKRVILLVLVLSAMAAAQTTCTLSSIVGTYAVSYIGWVSLAQPGGTMVTLPGTIVGVISIGYDGKLSGGGTTSMAGMGPAADWDISGTATVNSDCSGTLKMTPKPRAGGPAGSQTDRFVFNSYDRSLLTTIVDLAQGQVVFYPAIVGTWKQVSAVPNTAAW